MLVEVKCPVKIGQMVWLRNGNSIEHVKVTAFEAKASEQRVRLERQDKERAIWVDTEEYNTEFSADPRVILDRIENGSVIETMQGELEDPTEVETVEEETTEGEEPTADVESVDGKE